MDCRKRRQNDEWFCPKCGLRWGTDEPIPDAAECNHGVTSHQQPGDEDGRNTTEDGHTAHRYDGRQSPVDDDGIGTQS